MADSFIAEIRIFGCNFAPKNWAQCNGQLLSIAQNTALFSLLGTTYGGNGTQTFGLPNLQGRAALSQGQGPGLSPYQLGQTGGQSTVTLIASQMPAHTHSFAASASNGNSSSPSGNLLAVPSADRDVEVYTNNNTPVQMSTTMLAATGGSQPHNNMMPYLAINFCICMFGIYPSRN